MFTFWRVQNISIKFSALKVMCLRRVLKREYTIIHYTSYLLHFSVIYTVVIKHSSHVTITTTCWRWLPDSCIYAIYIFTTNSTLNPYFFIVSIRRRQEEYHPQLERSEFYSMENLSKQAVLFNPIPEYEESHTKVLGLDIETGNAIIT